MDTHYPFPSLPSPSHPLPPGRSRGEYTDRQTAGLLYATEIVSECLKRLCIHLLFTINGRQNEINTK